jgi:hypothetical protein
MSARTGRLGRRPWRRSLSCGWMVARRSSRGGLDRPAPVHPAHGRRARPAAAAAEHLPASRAGARRRPRGPALGACRGPGSSVRWQTLGLGAIAATSRTHPERPPGMRVARGGPPSGLTGVPEARAGWCRGARWLRWPRRAGPASGARQRGTVAGDGKDGGPLARMAVETGRCTVHEGFSAEDRASHRCLAAGRPRRLRRPPGWRVASAAGRRARAKRRAGPPPLVVRALARVPDGDRARQAPPRGSRPTRRTRDGAGRRDRRSEDALRAASERRRPGSAAHVRGGHRRGRAATE